MTPVSPIHSDSPDQSGTGLERFIESGLSASIASCDVRNVPSLARVYGCHCRPDGRLAVFVSRSQSAVLLRDLEATGAVAVVFSRPSSHQTIQVKGRGVTLGVLQAGDGERVRAQMDLLLADILSIGFPPAAIQTLLQYDESDLLAVEFVPDAVFGQSPGPRAGERLEGVRAP